jgi:hypothetical protein
MPRALLVVSLLALFAVPAVPAVAQSHYAPPGDTVRYRWGVKTNVIVSTPQGEIPVNADQSGVVAMTRLPHDSALVWFESLAISASTPAGEQKPSTAELVGKPYRVAFSPRGRVHLGEAPAIPQELEGMGDLRHVFDDFFLRLPAKPLAVGLAWSDTVTRSDSSADRWMRVGAVSEYRVERDTVVNGVPALVVAMKEHVDIQAENPVPNAPAPGHTTLTGTDTGYFVFAPKSGRVLGRRHEGHFTGAMVMGAPANMEMKQAIDISATVDEVW